MEEPKQYPSYRYYADGRAVVVQNQTEFDALEAGHAATPHPVPQDPASAPTQPVGVTDNPPDASGVTMDRAEQDTSRRARELRDEGKSPEEIAMLLGVTPVTVRRLLGEG